MGRLFLVDLDEQQYPYFYMCKYCGTKIAIQNHYKGVKWDNEFPGGIFEKAVNVTVERSDKHRQVGDHKVADVHCIKCCSYLGFKYIEVSPQQNVIEDGADESVVENNMVKLIMPKFVLKWVNEYIYIVANLAAMFP